MSQCIIIECIKAKINLYNGKVNTNFHGNKIPNENQLHTYLSVILFDSVIKVNEKYYSQIPLEECKYAVKEKVNKSY